MIIEELKKIENKISDAKKMLADGLDELAKAMQKIGYEYAVMKWTDLDGGKVRKNFGPAESEQDALKRLSILLDEKDEKTEYFLVCREKGSLLWNLDRYWRAEKPLYGKDGEFTLTTVFERQKEKSPKPDCKKEYSVQCVEKGYEWPNVVRKRIGSAVFQTFETAEKHAEYLRKENPGFKYRVIWRPADSDPGTADWDWWGVCKKTSARTKKEYAVEQAWKDSEWSGKPCAGSVFDTRREAREHKKYLDGKYQDCKHRVVSRPRRNFRGRLEDFDKDWVPEK